MPESPEIRVQTGKGADGKPSYATCTFRHEVVPDPVATRETGKPSFQKILLVRIKYPGSLDTLDKELRRYAQDGSVQSEDAAALRIYGEAAGAFERNESDVQAGTPLGVLNLDPVTEALLHAHGVRTVEALADVPDSNLDAFGNGSRATRQKGIDFLAGQDAGAGRAKAEAEAKALRDELVAAQQDRDAMRAELAALKAQVEKAKR